MKVRSAWHHAVGIGAAAILLAGCGASQPTPPSSSAQATALSAKAKPACGLPRAGEAQCLVMIESGVAGASESGWAPSDFQARYKLPSGTKGKGQIVAIVDAYDNPNVASDLEAYRSEFHLATAKFKKYNQDGRQGDYPSGSSSWGLEIDLDVEMVSASCPLCTIDLVEANGSDSSDLETAEAEAVKLGAHIVSNSWTCYGSVSCARQKYFDTKGVEYVAADGDGGSGELGTPAVFDSVAAIGGTQLSKSGSQYSESVWTDTGGCATDIKKPKWQHDTVCNGRAIGDASAEAGCSPGVAEYDSYGLDGWIEACGTSVSAPLLAGVFGLAENATKQDGGRTFWESKHHRDSYDVCASSCLFATYSYGGGWGSPDGIGAF